MSMYGILAFGVVLWLNLCACSGSTWFVYKPHNPIKISEGTTATFRWEFSSSLRLVLTQWTELEENGGFTLIAQRTGGHSAPVQYTTRLAGRVTIDGTATMHLQDVRPSDSGLYGCELTFDGDVKLKNVTRLIVLEGSTSGGSSERHLYWLFVGILLLLVLLVVVYIYLQRRRRRLFKQRQKQITLERNGAAPFTLESLEDSYDAPGSAAEYQVIPPIAHNPANMLDIGEYPRDSIVVVKVIGKGAFGLVAKGIAQLGGRKEGSVVALKMLKKNSTEEDQKDFLAELDLMKGLEHHPNVIALYGYVTESEPAMMIIEFVPYGDLLGHLRKSRGLHDTYFSDPDIAPISSLTSRQLFTYAWHVANGMAFLASKKIIHRDLAARNVLVGGGEMCKITDFGLARNVHKDSIYTRTSRGRLPVKWTAVESLLYAICTSMSDVWSYGIVLYEIFTIGGSPYPATDGKSLANLLQEGYRMPKPTHFNDVLYGIMMDCWQEKPDERPTFTELREKMQDMADAGHDEYVRLEEYDAKLYENLDDLEV